MSGESRIHRGSFVGVAADVTVECPFTPRSVELWADGGAAIEHGYKSEEMAGDAYLSTSTGTDAGVTIADQSFVVANGADINVATAVVYYEVRD